MTVHFESEPDLRRMSQTACSLLALIGNCGEIRWDYPSKGSDVKKASVSPQQMPKNCSN